jgi:hypothetical protein
MKKITGMIALVLFVMLVSASCKTKAHCDAYSGMHDQQEQPAH